MRLLGVWVWVASAACVSAAWAGNQPPIFEDLTYEKGVEASRGGKLLVVKFTAEWCGPCKKMDKTTWRDERVVKWFKDNNAKVIAVDVDKHEKVARDQRVRVLPTMVMYRDGAEVDRVVGGLDAEKLIEWASDAARGDTTAKKAQRKLARIKEDKDNLSMQQRMELASRLVELGEHDQATEEYLWLWDHMVEREPAMRGVRGSFLISDFKRLISASDKARKRFAARRDELEANLKDEGSRKWHELQDWIHLNNALGDEDRTLAWIDRIKGDEAGRKTLRRVGYPVTSILEAHQRWDDLIDLAPSAKSILAGDLQLIVMTRNIEREHDRGNDSLPSPAEYQLTRARAKAASMYAALHSKGRADEADELARSLFKVDDSKATRLDLVEAALDKGAAHENMRALLSEADAKDARREALLVRLDRALRK